MLERIYAGTKTQNSAEHALVFLKWYVETGRKVSHGYRIYMGQSTYSKAQLVQRLGLTKAVHFINMSKRKYPRNHSTIHTHRIVSYQPSISRTTDVGGLEGLSNDC